MIRISVRHDIDRLGRTLERLQRDQLPFAVARALTATARQAGQDFTATLPAVLDRPTPFTRRSTGVTPARKATPEAVVFVKEVQARYLGRLETGGTRLPEKRALVLPAGVRLNQYGNMPRRRLAQLKSRKDVFSGTVNGVGGFWQRTKGGGLKLLAAFRPRAEYKPILGFVSTVTASVGRTFPGELRAALVHALKTARSKG